MTIEITTTATTNMLLLLLRQLPMMMTIMEDDDDDDINNNKNNKKRLLTRGVPRVITQIPRQTGGEGGEEKVHSPGGDHVVVDGHESRDEHHGVAHALEERGGLPHGDGAQAGELAERQLHEHQRQPAQHQHHHVGDEERPWMARIVFLVLQGERWTTV